MSSYKLNNTEDSGTGLPPTVNTSNISNAEGLAHAGDSGSHDKSVASVELKSPYEPIHCVDQFGNDYVCINLYQATRLYDMLISMQARGIRGYDTGDWWLDLPVLLNNFAEAVRDRFRAKHSSERKASKRASPEDLNQGGEDE